MSRSILRAVIFVWVAILGVLINTCQWSTNVSGETVTSNVSTPSFDGYNRHNQSDLNATLTAYTDNAVTAAQSDNYSLTITSSSISQTGSGASMSPTTQGQESRYSTQNSDVRDAESVSTPTPAMLSNVTGSSTQMTPPGTSTEISTETNNSTQNNGTTAVSTPPASYDHRTNSSIVSTTGATSHSRSTSTTLTPSNVGISENRQFKLNTLWTAPSQNPTTRESTTAIIVPNSSQTIKGETISTVSTFSSNHEAPSLTPTYDVNVTSHYNSTSVTSEAPTVDTSYNVSVPDMSTELSPSQPSSISTVNSDRTTMTLSTAAAASTKDSFTSAVHDASSATSALPVSMTKGITTFSTLLPNVTSSMTPSTTSSASSQATTTSYTVAEESTHVAMPSSLPSAQTSHVSPAMSAAAIVTTSAVTKTALMTSSQLVTDATSAVTATPLVGEAKPPNLSLILGLGIPAFTGIAVVGLICYCRKRRRKSTGGTLTTSAAIGRPCHACAWIQIEFKGFPWSKPYRSDRSSVEETEIDGTDIEFELASTNSPDVVGLIINQSNLLSHVSRRQDNPTLYSTEFSSLPRSNIKVVSVAKKPDNAIKNRYLDILPYNDTRVRLKSQPTLYINASHIEGFNKNHSYIATQGPLPSTVNDFWQMVWDHNCFRIAMVTRLEEAGRVKCAQYWPEMTQQNQTYGNVAVTLLDEDEQADWIVRRLSVQQAATTRTITHYLYTSWPDHGTPQFCTSLLKFRELLFKKGNQRSNVSEGPVIVHCSAGVGRTGTLIAIDILLTQVTDQKRVNIVGCIETLRHQRMSMVQTLPQYIFIHHALLEYALLGQVSVSCSQFKQQYPLLRQPVPPFDVTQLQLQYKVLETLKPRTNAFMYETANQSFNRLRNRSSTPLPLDDVMVAIRPSAENTTGYINAVRVAIRKKTAARDCVSETTGNRTSSSQLVVTQMPIMDHATNTVNDFWQLVTDTQCSVIVMLNSSTDKDPQYLPVDGASITTERFQIVNVGEITADDIQLTTLKIIGKADDSSHGRADDVKLTSTGHRRKHKGCASTAGGTPVQEQWVRHLRPLNWDDDQLVPDNRTTLLDLCEQVFRCQLKSPNSGIIVHCLNGAEKSGLFCGLLNVLNHIRNEDEVDVFNAVKLIRQSRPEFVNNEDQYGFIYDSVSTYLSADYVPSLTLKNCRFM